MDCVDDFQNYKMAAVDTAAANYELYHIYLPLSREKLVLSRHCQNFCIAFGDSHGMLKMCRVAAIDRDHSPVISKDASLLRTHNDHGLYGNNHAWLQCIAWISLLNIVQDLGVFVHTTTDTMSTILAYDRETSRLNVLLNRATDISGTISCTSRSDAAVERVFRHLQQSLHFR